jgi:butyryl-CoA dehydrogenase
MTDARTVLFTEKEIVDLARRISSKRIAPSARERDGNGDFPWEAMRVLGECGPMGMIVSERDNGTGANRAAFASAASEVAKACSSTALVYVSHAIALNAAIEVADSQAIRTKWLASMMNGQALGAFAIHEPNSGSHAGAIATTARKEGDHYLVNGSKFFILS